MVGQVGAEELEKSQIAVYKPDYRLQARFDRLINEASINNL